jgi:Skp family chaperone for outer membrane proteins
MSDEARSKKQNEIQERIMKFQELTQKSQGEIQQKEHTLTEPIITRLRTLVAETAKKKGMTVVLEKNDATVLYSLDKDDLTNEIIDLFNKSKG